MPQLRASSLAATILVFAMAVAALADEPSVKLTIYPAAAPRPALKYQLLPDFKTRIRGNAAVYYGKVTAERISFFSNRERLNRIDNYRSLPLADLRKDDIDMPTGDIEDILTRAARCESCDWQLPLREEEFYTILLPEVQQTREFARILGARARIQIARGEFEGAIATFQTGYALARNVASGETLVNGLVGIAISGILSEQVLEFIQQPEAPNLYWALTLLPRPLVDLRPGVESELCAFELSFPELRDLHTKRTEAEWGQTLHRFWEKVLRLSAGNDKNRPTAIALAAASLQQYDKAKRDLLDRGYKAETVEAMPAAQAVLIYTIRSYEDVRDDRLKWFFAPHSSGAEQIKSTTVERDVARTVDQEENDEGEDNPLVTFLLADGNPARLASARMERQMAILRFVEALRIHGEANGGHLPHVLTEVTEAPLPIDPVTGKPFDYRLEGDVAILSLTPMPGRPSRYEIQMARH